MSLQLLDRIKRRVIIGLVTDDELMEKLVLKGGNALNIAYAMGKRGSVDIDFSMEGDFDDLEQARLRIEQGLQSSFAEEDLHVLDVKLIKRPSNLDPSLQGFWGGYHVEFKLADQARMEKYKDRPDRLSADSLDLGGGVKKFTIDISPYEYCEPKVAKEIEGYTYYVYSLQLIVFEKVRAICQQLPEYKDIVLANTASARPRDFYDIYEIMTEHIIDVQSEESLDTLRHVFDAKRVPYSFLAQLPDSRSWHQTAYKSLRDTVTNADNLQSFDFYFDYVVKNFCHLEL